MVSAGVIRVSFHPFFNKHTMQLIKHRMPRPSCFAQYAFDDMIHILARPLTKLNGHGLLMTCIASMSCG